MLKEVKFQMKGGAELRKPNFEDEPVSGGELGGGEESEANPPYKILPHKPKRFKGPEKPSQLGPPNFDSDVPSGGAGGGGKKYPDMPEIKRCNPSGMRYVRRCPNNNIEKGCGGQNVQDVQVQLIRLGFDLPRWRADCKYGDETKQSVMDFQVSKGIPNTGIVDQRTYNKLFASSASNTPSSPSAAPVTQQPAQGGSAGPRSVRFRSGGGGGGNGLAPPNLDENLNLNIFKDAKNLNNRYEKIENLVFERLVKGCK